VILLRVFVDLGVIVGRVEFAMMNIKLLVVPTNVSL